MTDDFDPTVSSRASWGGEQAGMDPEGLLPADSALHEQDALPPDLATLDALTTPHDQPAEGGREKAEDGAPDARG